MGHLAQGVLDGGRPPAASHLCHKPYAAPFLRAWSAGVRGMVPKCLPRRSLPKSLAAALNKPPPLSHS